MRKFRVVKTAVVFFVAISVVSWRLCIHLTYTVFERNSGNKCTQELATKYT